MNKKSILYILLMILFFFFAYLFINSGLKFKIMNNVNYDFKSNLKYKVYLKDNNIFENNIIDQDKKYITNMVDKIDMDFSYDILYSKNINGYYSYSVDTSLVAYEDNINDSLWCKSDKILSDKIFVLDQNNTKNISFDDSFSINFNKYRKMIDDFIDDYKTPVSAYLMVKINFNLVGEFNVFDKTINDNKSIKVIIPLTYDTFKINVINNKNGVYSYSEFKNKSNINYIFLVIGLLFMSIGFAFMALVIRHIVMLYKGESKYSKELKSILRKYDPIIINVKNIYKDKKYSLIYVDSFKELLDVYDRLKVPISFKEIKRNRECIFLLLDGDNAWIYILKSNVN